MSRHAGTEFEEKKGDQFTTATGPADANVSADYVEHEGHAGLKRQLKSRHMAMISIGGVIGTGLFLGTGGALANGGPAGLFLGYLVMGSITYAVMICLGEMVAYLPLEGGHIMLARRFVDPAFSFMMGWNYWYNWVIILPAELSAAAVLVHFWTANLGGGFWGTAAADGVFITLFFLVVLAINFMGAGVYGESEFWFASIKVLTITGLIILGIIITCGGVGGQKIGFKYWVSPGAFTQYNGIPGTTGQFLGFWAVLTQAAFSYIGTEIVAIAAGEAKNPRRNLPRAIKRVYIRILIFYLGGTFIIGMLVNYDNPSLRLNSGTAKSPFVIAIVNAGIPALPSIINACLITSAWSAASSDLYTSSRALYGLARSGQAPKIFTKTTRGGLPYIAIGTCAAFALLAYMSLNSGAGTVFGYFANLTAAAGLITWWGICVIYLRFHAGMRAQGITRESLPYTTFLTKGCFAAYYALTLITIILFFSGFSVFLKGNWDVSDFVTAYFPIWLAPVVFIAAKLWKKSKWLKPEEMDFVSGLAEVEADTYDEPPPRNMVEKVWQWIM